MIPSQALEERRAAYTRPDLIDIKKQKYGGLTSKKRKKKEVYSASKSIQTFLLLIGNNTCELEHGNVVTISPHFNVHRFIICMDPVLTRSKKTSESFCRIEIEKIQVILKIRSRLSLFRIHSTRLTNKVNVTEDLMNSLAFFHSA